MSEEPKINYHQRAQDIEQELRVRDSMMNLQEFTLAMAAKSYLNNFDLISVTRIDSPEPYTQHFYHHSVNSTYECTPGETAEIIPLPVNKQKNP